MKSKMLSILYGEHNVLAEDISCKDVKVQSEKTRHGINCVELPETLGDGSKLAVEKVRAFITARFYKGVRDAYGSNYDRLTALKGKYDPTNFFNSNRNIEPRT